MPRLAQYRWLVVLLLFISATGLQPGLAEANAGPPRYRGDAGGPLLPDVSHQVHVLSERLSFHLEPGLDAAEVTARYVLENRGEDLPAQSFVFVVQGVSDAGDLGLMAAWEGQMLEVTEVDLSALAPDQIQEMKQAWTTAETLLDPVTDEVYQAGQYGEDVLRYFTFDVSLPAGVSGELTATYRARGNYDRDRYTHVVYNYHYLLLPAQGWASFGPLEIEVRAPEGTEHYFASNLPFHFEDGVHRASFDTLPDENLTFAVMSREGILLGVVQPGPYWWMAFTIVMLLAVGVGLGLGWLTGQIPARGLAPWVSFLGSLLLGGFCHFYLATAVIRIFPTLNNHGYSVIFAASGFALAGAVVSAVIARWFALRTWQTRTLG